MQFDYTSLPLEGNFFSDDDRSAQALPHYHERNYVKTYSVFLRWSLKFEFKWGEVLF